MLFSVNSPRIIVFLFALPALCFGKNGNAPFPHAITFTPSSILASRVTQSGEIEVSSFVAGDQYKAYFDDALIHHGKVSKGYVLGDQDAAIPMFRDAVKDVSLSMVETLPPIAVLMMPSVFNFSSSDAAGTALFPDGLETEDGPKMVNYVAMAASFAYRLDQCENLDLTPAECEVADSLMHLILIVELEKQYLYLHLRDADTEWGVFTTIRKQLFEGLGEQSGHDLREKIGTKEYTEKLVNAFNDFIEYALTPPYKKEHITAIVLAGEASGPAFAEIKEIAYNAIDNGKVRVFDSIDPAVVAAHGAALYARQTVVRRDLWGYKNDQKVENLHDEL